MSMIWSEDQKEALAEMESGRSVFITGGAGTGKSTLTKHFCKGRKIARLATTGAAAVLIGGQTVHSFFGLPPHIHQPGDVSEGRREVSQKHLRRIASFDGFLIDEISMLRIDLFQAIVETMAVARLMRGGKPFQLIAVGDFAQLPPVVTNEERPALRHGYGNRVFAFEHDVWSSLRPHALSVIHRQAGDSRYAQWLSGVRRGHVEDLTLVNERVGPAPAEAVLLVGTNAAAAKINDMKMDALPGNDVILRGRMAGSFNEKNVRVPLSYRMRQGARVIICKNNPQAGYVNGSVGTIEKLGKTKDHEIAAKVRLDNGKTVHVTEAIWEQISYERVNGEYHPVVTGSFKQLPLLPGWAITIHRSQGMSLETAHADLGNLFESGQAYVALSRVTTLQGLSLTSPVQEDDLFPHAKVAKYHAGIEKIDSTDLLLAIS